MRTKLRLCFRSRHKIFCAGGETADAPDLGSGGAIRRGSSPLPRTTLIQTQILRFTPFSLKCKPILFFSIFTRYTSNCRIIVGKKFLSVSQAEIFFSKSALFRNCRIKIRNCRINFPVLLRVPLALAQTRFQLLNSRAPLRLT